MVLATVQPEQAWSFEPDRFDSVAPSYLTDNRSLMGSTALNYSADYFDITGLETAS